MSEQTAENGTSTTANALAPATAAVTTLSPSKPIIITKSIKLNEPSTPIVLTGNQENLNESTDKDSKSELKALTPEQKMEMRIKKFGVQSENAKLNQRAQRFGGEVASNAPADDSKLNKRAERFGISNNASAPSTPSVSAEVLEKRSKRFGNASESNGSTAPATAESSDLLLKRKERFGVVNEDDKKKLRSQRFETKA